VVAVKRFVREMMLRARRKKPRQPSAPISDPRIQIAPGTSIQTVTDANPAGSHFLLLSGTHVQQNVLPKAGNIYEGQGVSTILDGQDITTFAFRVNLAAPNDVTIKNMRITRYNPASSDPAYGCILGGGHAPTDGASGWIIENVTIDDFAGCGIRLGHTMQVTNCTVHDGTVLGLAGIGDDVLIESNEIYNMNVGTSNPDAGGTKFVKNNGGIYRDNYIHDNNGPGLWLDIANDDFLVEDNLVEDNVQEGICVEISYGGIVQNNTCRRNGMDDTRANAWPWGAGIGIHASGGGSVQTGKSISVTGNILEGNAYGVSLIQQPRGTNYGGEPSGIDPEMYVMNVSVTNNTITLQTNSGYLWPDSWGSCWGVQDVGSTAIFTSRNNTFQGNVYILNGEAQPFAWNQATRTWAGWQGQGHDSTGSATL
jgi:parallel beta-helix repeat protein